MRVRKLLYGSIASISICVSSLLIPATTLADPGDFWYGLYNVGYGPNSTWQDSTWRVLGERYRMNWALTSITEADTANGELESAKAYGIGIMQWAVHEGPFEAGPDSAVIFWQYSNAAHMKFQAEGDTILYQWNSYYHTGCETWFGVFVRQNDSGAGSRVYDDMAIRDSAWMFDPAVDSTLDSVFAVFHGLGGDAPSREFFFPFRIRAETNGCTGDLVHLVLRKDILGMTCESPIFVTLAETTLTCMDFPDTNYHPFDLAYQGEHEWDLYPVVEWYGEAKVWVDEFGVQDVFGQRLSDGLADTAITSYADRYSFNGDPGIIGFYMMEELWQDANVYPQKRVDELIRAAAGSLIPFTEHSGTVYWWGDHQYAPRQQYGGRKAVSARLQPGTPTSGLFYPYDGYHLERVDPIDKQAFDLAASVDTVLHVLSTDDCTAGDTTICLQEQLNTLSWKLALDKGLADSTANKFMPFLQAYSTETRLPPNTCTGDLDPPWQVAQREQIEEEAKLLASMALAHGANGLLYYVMGSYGTLYKTLYLPCGEDSTYVVHDWPWAQNWKGFVDLPGVQSALETYVGPLVDSLGSLFYDFDWQWAGRVDLMDSPPSPRINSVESKTYPSGDAYIHAGVYKLGGDDYFFFVNRRAYDTIPQDIVAWLIPQTEGMYYLIDVYDNDTVFTGTMMDGRLPVQLTLPPGEGRLIELAYAGISSVSGSTVDLPYWLPWTGGISVSGDLIVDTSHNLQVVAPAQMYCLADSNISIDVYGELHMTGTNEDSVYIVSAATSPAAGDWYGIRLRGAAGLYEGILELRYAQVKHAYKGVWISNTEDTLAALIDHCHFDSMSFAGVSVDASADYDWLDIKNSRFSNWGYYGIQIHEGIADIDSNYFTGTGRYGIYVDGGFRQAVIGGHIRNNRFEDLSRSDAIGVNIYGVRDDGLDWSSESFLSDNVFMFDAPFGTANQMGVYINNCLDTIRFFRNSVRGNVGWPGYGVLNYSTSSIWMGDTTSAESLSVVEGTTYAFYAFPSSSSDNDYATIRQTSINPLSSSVAYGVWLVNYGKIDLGDVGDPGSNVLYGDLDCCGVSAPPIQFTVYSNASDSVLALGNYWPGQYCFRTQPDPCWPFVYGPVIHIGKLSNNPFPSVGPPLLKVAIGSSSADGNDLIFGGLTNYPNPFNASTVIQFSLPKAGHVEAEVFNILGQKVKTLWNGHMEAGVRSISWGGLDDTGHPLSSGVYLYRIVAEEGQLTKSMVVLK